MCALLTFIYCLDFGFNVELSGGLTAFLTPSLELGLTILGGSVMDATVWSYDCWGQDFFIELPLGVCSSRAVRWAQLERKCIRIGKIV